MYNDSNVNILPSTSTSVIPIFQKHKRDSSSSFSESLSNGEIPAKKRIDNICDGLASAHSQISLPDNNFSSNLVGPGSLDSYSESTNLLDCNDTDNDESALSLSHSCMDQDLKFIIQKFVRADYVIHCLELSGFDSPPVFMCLTDTNIKQLEEFVRYTCSLIQSRKVRQHYLGPVFANHPSSFRFPTGVICGLRLAIEELKRNSNSTLTGDNIISNGASLSVCSSHVRTPSSTPGASFYDHCPESTQFGLSNPIMQTEIPFSVPISSTPIHIPTSTSDVLHLNRSPPSNSPASKKEAPDAPFNSPPTLRPTCNSSSVDVPVFPDCCASPDVLQTTSDADEIVSDAEFLHSNCSNSSLEKNSSDLNTGPGKFDPPGSQSILKSSLTSAAHTIPELSLHDDINTTISLNHLIEHSSASACRLAARQFLNARLIRGVDFDMEMELTGSENGYKRITGIFYCHLCRERRERTCAVRFSVARNRYPVMSNVLSHLKTHFQYRTLGGQPIVAPRRSSSIGQSSPDKSNSSPMPNSQTNSFILNNSLQDLVSQVMHFTSTTTSDVSNFLRPLESRLGTDEKKELLSQNLHQSVTSTSTPSVSSSSKSLHLNT